MSLIRWDPFDDLASLRESMDKLFDEFFTHRPERGRLAPVVWQRRELRHGAFIRSIALPAGVHGDQAKASYRNGILEIRVPKSERAKPKTVKVEVGE